MAKIKKSILHSYLTDNDKNPFKFVTELITVITYYVTNAGANIIKHITAVSYDFL